MPSTVTDKNGDLKVWWIPQVPGKPFEIHVKDKQEASKVLNVLADYDAFQLENKIKLDYANAGGLMIFEDGEWVDCEMGSDWLL